MKKLIWMFAACCISISALAQKITDRDLQGNWKLTGFNHNGVTVDVKTGVVSVSEEMKAQLSPEMMSQIDESVKDVIEPLRTSSVTITGYSIVEKIGVQEKNGIYTLKESDGRLLMATAWDDQTTTETTVWIKNNQLYIFRYEQGQSAEFVYNKV